MKYRCLSQRRFTKKEFVLDSLEEKHSEPIRIWRNAQKRILRQEKDLSQEDQEKYFKEVVLNLYNQEQPDQILFAYFKSNQFIGYGGLTHISWSSQRAEVSFLVDPVYPEEGAVYSEMFSIFLEMLQKICITELNFHRLFVETYDVRTKHLLLLKSQGFLFEGRMIDHVIVDGRFYDSLIYGCILKK